MIRHSRNPVWDEKLLFHVRRYETSFKVNLAILDWDKLSSNDYVGDVSFDVRGLMESAPQPDPGTGLYAVDEGAEGGEHPMVEYKLPLVGNASWEGKYSPILSFRCVFFTLPDVTSPHPPLCTERNTNPTTPSDNGSGVNT